MKQTILQKQETNVWMVATLILAVVCVVFMGYGVWKENKLNEEFKVNLGTFNMSQANFGNLTEQMLNANKTRMQICELETGNCMILVLREDR